MRIEYFGGGMGERTVVFIKPLWWAVMMFFLSERIGDAFNDYFF